EILDWQVARQELAVAVHQVGTRRDDCRGAAAFPGFEQGDMDETDSHQRESGNTQDRSDNDAPLVNGLAHILTYWGRAPAAQPEAGRWRCGPGCCSAAQARCRGAESGRRS